MRMSPLFKGRPQIVLRCGSKLLVGFWAQDQGLGSSIFSDCGAYRTERFAPCHWPLHRVNAELPPERCATSHWPLHRVNAELPPEIRVVGIHRDVTEGFNARRSAGNRGQSLGA